MLVAGGALSFWCLCVTLADGGRIEGSRNGGFVGGNSSNERPYEGYEVMRVETTSKTVMRMLQRLEMESNGKYDFWSPPRLGQPMDIAMSGKDAGYLHDALKRLGASGEIVIGNLQELLDSSERDMKRQEAEMSWSSYHNLNTIYNWLYDIQLQYPHLVKILNIGSSFENRTLIVVKISFKDGGTEVDKPAVWIDGGVHAREWVSPAAVTFLIKEFLNDSMSKVNEGVEMKLSDKFPVIKRFDWYFMPMANPDGYEFSWKEAKNRFWRKTRSLPRSTYRSKVSLNSGINKCVGVDANRNFNYKWGGPGTSSSICSDIYKGPGAGSEPEVAAMQKFLMDHRTSIKLYASFHSYSQMILIPWGYSYSTTEDYKELERVATRAQEEMHQLYGETYLLGHTAKLLGASAGNSMDFAKGVAGIKYAYGFELRDKGNSGFLLPGTQIMPAAQEALVGIISMTYDIAEAYNITQIS